MDNIHVTDEDFEMGDEVESPRSALFQIVHSLVSVAEGGPLGPAVQTIQRVFPKTKAEADVMIEQMRRLQQATERLVSVARECYVAVK